MFKKFRGLFSNDLSIDLGTANTLIFVRGQGIVYQPEFIVGGAITRGELVVLDLDQPTMALGGIHVLYPPDRRPPAKVRVMIDYLAEVFDTHAAPG